jgi:pimeloyl-ACP methyl ester carboxylesterase
MSRWNILAATQIAAALLGGVPTAEAGGPALARSDFQVATVDGQTIRVREVRPQAGSDAEPLVLVHGARVPGIASFDLDVVNGSLAADLASRLGRAVYVMDARGYGGSSRAVAMDKPPGESRPLSRANEVVRDIDAVVREASRRSARTQVGLLGWATGGMWAAYYASLWPEHVGHLVALNALYGGASAHPTLGPGSSNSDPARPDRIKPNTGGYALYDAASLWPSWDRSIPSLDKASWRDPALAKAYAEAAVRSDPQSDRHSPAAFRAPLGAIEDSFYQAGGRRLFDASSITAPVLVIRSERDFWSRPEDASAFAHDAVRAASVRVVTIPGATHYVHLDRPEHGRDRLMGELVGFLRSPTATASKGD